jgi:hypothetical protein
MLKKIEAFRRSLFGKLEIEAGGLVSGNGNIAVAAYRVPVHYVDIGHIGESGAAEESRQSENGDEFFHLYTSLFKD